MHWTCGSMGWLVGWMVGWFGNKQLLVLAGS